MYDIDLTGLIVLAWIGAAAVIVFILAIPLGIIWLAHHVSISLN